jgi:competence protein ComGC
MFKTVQSALRDKKGSGIFEFIIILAIVAIIAVTTLPELNDKITEQANNAVDRIEEMQFE